jgi:large subunit ribosomal protein L29
MKAGELRELTVEELRQKHDDWQTQYFRMRVKHALGQMENPLMLRSIRRDLARAKTLLVEQGVDVTRQQSRGASSPKAGKSKAQKPKAGSDA